MNAIVRCAKLPRDSPEGQGRARGPLVVAFWVFSLLFGVGAALGADWGLLLLVAWLFLAMTTLGLLMESTPPTCSSARSPRAGARSGAPA